MSNSPLSRSRGRSRGRSRSRSGGSKDITGVDSLLARAGVGAEGGIGVSSRLAPLRAAVGVILFAVLALGCAPSRPIAPVRAPTSDATADQEFDADQRARLDHLYIALDAAPDAALAEPHSSALFGGLLVRLAFDEAADLDLFVTDPMQESVYFANSPTRSGGTLVDDRRCEDPSPRVEVVHFSDPAPGRYRVGVDFPRRCQDTSLSGAEEKQGLYVVRVEEGARVMEREGKVIPGQFEVIVIEFDVE